MIKNKINFEIKILERVYEFVCSPDSPLGEIHDALSQMKSFVIQKINEANDKETNVEEPTAGKE